MGYIKDSAYCPHCRRRRLVHKRAPSHVIHALLTLSLCGLWLPVWVLCALASTAFEPWRCGRCGTNV